MIVGTIREIKNNENRVGLTPIGVKHLVEKGHTVYIQKGAGGGSGIKDREYKKAGGIIIDNPKEVCEKSEIIVKVKEPLSQEYDYFKDKILFTYFHFASSRELTLAMKERNVVCIAYETIEKDGTLPLLKPMSEVAGRMVPLLAAYYLGKPKKGKGILVCGVEGVPPAKAVIFGGGIVGENALKSMLALEAKVVVFEINEKNIEYLKERYPKATILKSEKEKILEEIKNADIVVGAVSVRGGKAPVVVTEDMVRKMQKGSLIIDVAIDQGGCIETSRPTTHSKPTYKKYGVIHYCVPNMPAAYPQTSTFALTSATLPYVEKLADSGLNALKEDEGFRKGLNMYKGKITNKGVADAFGMEYSEPLLS